MAVPADYAQFTTEPDRQARMAERRNRMDAKWADDFVQACVRSTFARAMAVAQQRAIDDAHCALASIEESESPLEWGFMACWHLFRCHVPDEYSHPCELAISPQVQVGRYRVDFQIVPCYDCTNDRPAVLNFPLVAIELDGHEFHEKTKEQVTRRNKRDRDLAAAHWQILRYSGSEFYRDPYGCVEQAYAVGNKLALECWYAESAIGRRRGA